MVELGRKIGVGGFDVTPLMRQYVNEVLDSGRLSYGPFHRRFESAFAAAHDSKFAIFCNSGTSALQIALQALKERHGWKDGDEIIVPATTFVATVNIVLHNRMRPVFVDVERGTWNINPGKIEDAITCKTRAIIPVHLLGLPADMGPIEQIAKKHDLKIIEDSCESMFAKYRGKKVGALGDIGCFSTYIAHYIITGVGGLITTSDPEMHVKMRSLINHGRDPAYLSIDDKDPNLAAIRFKFTSVGHSFRATELEAALGLAQMEGWEKIVFARQRIAAMLSLGLKKYEDRLIIQECPTDRSHVYMLFGIVLRKGKDKSALVKFLEDSGIETRDILPLLNQPIYSDVFDTCGKTPEDQFPVSKMLIKSGFYIGCHQGMSDDDVAYIIAKFEEFFDGRENV